MSGSRPLRAKAVSPRPTQDRLPARDLPRSPADFLVVGIGASAGGLDACSKLLGALPAGSGMAFILVQHLDPTHESMLVDLLSAHTAMTVQQAGDGMPLEPEHVYVIPPGTYLSVHAGALRLSPPQARRGARLPFDFLLHSLAADRGDRAVCVILSGTGADGTLGLKAVKERGGLVIAQDPDEAGYDGMPRSAIMTGAVNLVLPVANIPDALVDHSRHKALKRTQAGSCSRDTAQDRLPEIIDLLRTKTAHDFSRYKQGTLQRRIERRMGLAAVDPGDMGRYLDVLRNSKTELDTLAKDLLINVTSFFRDPQAFDLLKETFIPELVGRQPPDRPLRIWVAGCSTGEEAYSLAMLFREQITSAERALKLQVFASDVDPHAVAIAREGLYPETIEADVSLARLGRFFSREDHAYRVSPDLRAMVVFTVHDVLADPPFSRLDLISCRNLLIYLRPEAQAKVVSHFHFALRQGGILLLGSSETVGDADGRFQSISKPERLYRHIALSQPGELGFPVSDGARAPSLPTEGHAPARPAALAELCRRLVLETYAPAAILINRRNECLYSLGPTDRYLRVAPGHPSHDLLAMARKGLRAKLRSAIQQASQDHARIAVTGGQTTQDGKPDPFTIIVQPVLSDGEQLLLICFVDKTTHAQRGDRPVAARDVSRVAELEQELEATRTELRDAIRSLEISGEEQKAINEEALSATEEYQSTNEELLTSKEELQSLNEELTALNGQLQETLERQRTTFNDLQNVLYSTDVATLFLDADLKIRFFTPATKSLFSVIPSDVGRPLADLHSLATDGDLLTDAQTVLQTLAPKEQEVEGQNGTWYSRRVLPYRTQDNGVEGVVITFADITDRRHAADALEAAKREAELASVAKSRFLAAASHDLRQPLQTLALLQGLLAKSIEGKKAQEFVARVDETLGAMSGMLNTLLDLNQIEAGTIRPEMMTFRISDLLNRLRDEFTYHAQAQRLTLRVVPCSLSIRSDPRLLEQMIRNLLSNSLKYTKRGKVLLGCRRRQGRLSIEIWDTGVGIPNEELQAIFEEYRQLDNAARERSRGLGLGLSIVRRLSELLGHQVRVHSRPGDGSVFAIDVALAPQEANQSPEHRHDLDVASTGGSRRTGVILVVEDDPEVRELLDLLLRDEGHRVFTALNGAGALDLVTRGAVRPDVILADYNLPGGMNGLQLTSIARHKLQREIPSVILTGDISAATLRDIAHRECVRLSKPVKVQELTAVIRRLLPEPHTAENAGAPGPSASADSPGHPVIFVVDDDSHVREGIRSVLEEDGRIVEDYPTCEAFLQTYRPGREGCLLIDAYLPGMSGLELLRRLRVADDSLPAIMITGNSDVHMAVEAMKAGASDFVEKPIGYRELLADIERALEQSRDSSKLLAWREAAARHISGLTPRQREIMKLVLAGHPSKNIAADLGISQRTVENHRASIMKKTGTKSLPALARLALAAAD